MKIVFAIGDLYVPGFDCPNIIYHYSAHIFVGGSAFHSAQGVNFEILGRLHIRSPRHEDIAAVYKRRESAS